MNDTAALDARTESGSALIQAETAKQVQEIQASLVIAKRFPRDEAQSYARIMTACKRKQLAENAMYVYPRGGQTVTGPSIRLAEALAQSWGNVDFGIRELSQKDGVSEVEAYAWDMETNTRSRKIFHVPHVRYSKKGGNQKLTDPRDIYEMTANQGARRLRACILAIIPGDVVDSAIQQCEQTLAGASDEPLADRIKKMVLKFSEIGVSQEMLETRLGHKIGVTTLQEIIGLQKIYKSISDNFADRRDFFEFPEGDYQAPEAADLEAKLKKARGKGKGQTSLLGNDQPTPADQMAVTDCANEIRQLAQAKGEKIKGKMKENLDEWLKAEAAASTPDELDEKTAREWVTILRNL